MTERFAILGHPQRMALFRLLMRRYPDRVPATHLATALDIKPNTLSTYVRTLMQVGLITQERVGTSLRYGVNMDATRATFDFMWSDCCRGRPDLCATAFADRPLDIAPPKYSVLFVCTRNSARSIFAESIMRDIAGDRFDTFSAGTHPQAEIHPKALMLLQQKGHDLSLLRSKSVSTYRGDDPKQFDFVFTVCDQAANEDCPAWIGQPVSAHWGIPDPATADGTDALNALAFQQAFAAIHRRIETFVALPLAALNRISMQHAVDDIGREFAGKMI
ncbi:helix-turn-helix domain-containing protein [Loktanella sp. SALINAS62]|uniref:arsenate reductase/protein-tyrosine-phosphatase family protein n=1 Tax=Loktanella sp. SALINAS62 TaxID=2706124 RepID=UPI002011A1FE|nr:helix-turn-helix domain-containing protein [Loktanella sp. SALINAS62]